MSGYPQNQARGLPYITSLIILNDPDTGILRAVMDCTWVTAVRWCYDIDAERQTAYVREMSERMGIRIVPARTPREAVEGCDIVVTAGPILRYPQPGIEPEWLSPGVLAVPLDFDSHFTPANMRAMDLFVTDDTTQYL